MSESDTPNAILTEKQRKYLVNGPDEDMSADAERMIRSRIRERIKAGIVDLRTIFLHLGERDLEMIFEEIDFVSHPDAMLGTEYIKTPLVVQYALAFFLQRYETDKGAERGINEAFDRVSEKPYNTREWDVAVDSEDLTLSVEKLEEKLQEGEITPEDIRQYHDQGRIGFDAYIQLTRGLEMFKSISPERYQELLDDPVPMLEEDKNEEE